MGILSRRVLFLIFVTAAAIVSLVAWEPTGGAAGRCAVADVPFTVTLPDGSEHQAGSLRICADRSYSPVSTLHTIQIEGHSIGMFLSKTVMSEGLGVYRDPVFLFIRRPGGEMAFRGYAWPYGNRMIGYRMRIARRPGFGDVAGERSELERVMGDPASGSVLLTARPM